MSVGYRTKLLVAPFIAAPNDLIRTQSGLIYSSSELAEHESDVINQLGQRIDQEKPNLSVVTELLWLRGNVIAVTTVKTSTPEKFSGRPGLRLSFGAVINPKVFLRSSSPFVRAFEIIKTYFELEFGAPFSNQKAEDIIEKGQSGSMSNDDIFHEERLQTMRDEFENEFGTVGSVEVTPFNWPKLLVLKARLRTQPRFYSFNSLDDSGIPAYWAQLDESLSGTRQQAMPELASNPANPTVEPDTPNPSTLTSPATPKTTDTPDAEAIAQTASTELPYPLLLQSFQQAIATIWLNSYLGVLVLLAFLWGQTAAQKDITSIVKVIVAVLSFLMILQSTERLLFLLSLWGLLSRQPNLKSKQSGRAVLMSWPRLFLLLVACLGAILIAFTLFIVLAPDIYQLLRASFAEWPLWNTR